MTEMFNPPHPGKVLREYLGEMDVTDALGTHAGFWYDLQAGYDLWQAAHKKRPKIERFDVAV